MVKPVSPSSRLVLGVLVFAFVVLAVVGTLRPQVAANAGLEVTGGTSASTDVATAGSAGPSDAGAFPSTESSSSTTSPAPAGATAQATVNPTPTPSGCKPTDQDRYVYNSSRLAVQAGCIRVTGTVQAVRHEADGDLHILLALDPAYTGLLTPANQGKELGDLVVEPVCVRSVTQADAIGTCSSDPDPFRGSLPVVGEPVWMEGRYVFDLQHGGWAELHPLYRWGDK